MCVCVCVYIYIYICLFLRDLYFLNLIIHIYIYIEREHIWHKALLMEYSMRLELTGVCPFQLVMGLYRSHPLFFFECVYLSLLYPSLIFDMFLSLCVCVCVCMPGVVLDFTDNYFSSVCVCVCVCVCLGDFSCVYVWFEIYK